MTTRPPLNQKNSVPSAAGNSKEKGKVQIIPIGRNEQPTFPKVSNEHPIIYQVMGQEREEMLRTGSRKNSFQPIANTQPIKTNGNTDTTAVPEIVVTSENPEVAQASADPEIPKTSSSRQNESIDFIEEKKTLGCCIKVMIGLHIFFILVALGYGVSGYFTAFDEKGLDVYFEGDTTEYDLINGLAYKIANPTSEIKTENWGYFREAYSRVSDDSSSKWKDYNVFLYILITTGVTVIFCLAATSFSIHTLRLRKWSYATMGMIFHLIVLVLFLGGNGYVWYKIYCFHSDFKDSFEACNCDSFESDYYTSIKLYFLSTGVMFIVLATQIIMSIVHRCSVAKIDNSSS